MEAIFIVFVVIAGVIASVIKLAGKTSKTSEEEHTQVKTPPAREVTNPVLQSENKIIPRQYQQIVARKNTMDMTRVTSAGHHESHCDVKEHSSQDKYRVEKVPVMNSIGGKSEEGCQEHYDVRFVKEDEPQSEKRLELNDLQKAIVYGEILNNPAFRKNGYRRFR